MGHIRLDRLPKTRRWKEVIELLHQGRSIDELARATFYAAQTGLSRIPIDAGFTQTLTVIFGFIDALQSKTPVTSLRQKGFAVPTDASLFDYVGSFKARAEDAAAAVHARSDIAEIARDSFSQVLLKYAGSSLQTLFGVDSTDAKQALRSNLKGKPLGSTMHEFFATFTQRYLNYYLGRELPNHVGTGKAFSNVDGHSEFNKAFDLHVRQTVRIADEFTPGWFGKARYEERLSHKDVSRFAHTAFKKIRSEFRRGGEANG
ncbi:MAG: hypothetical protein ABII79_06270 [bacterium]